MTNFIKRFKLVNTQEGVCKYFYINNMDQKKRLILLGGLIILLGLAIYFVQTIPQDQQQPPEAVEFRGETEASKDQLTFTYIPKSEKTATYTTTYTLSEDQEVIKEAEEEEMGGISSSSPITISTDRDPEAEYEISMEIMDEYERMVYEDTLSISKLEEPSLASSTEALLSTYLEENATSVVEKNATMGGTWGFVEMKPVDTDELVIEALFEDGHIQSRYKIDFKISDEEEVEIEEKELLEEEEKIGAETKQVLTDFMSENATSIVKKNATMGGTWGFVEMETVDAEELIVEATFEDGHIQQILEIDFALEEGEVSYEVLGEIEKENEQTGGEFQDMAECTLLRCDGEVDCYGCMDGNCKNPEPDAECKPYEQAEVGIQHSCYVADGACQLAQ